jgi:AGCS family alanine or glycine:cation symporter
MDSEIQHAMSVLVGGWGAGFVAIIVLLFAFSSIVANYIYAENNLIFCVLIARYIWALRILTVLMVMRRAGQPAGRLAAGGYHHGADGHHQPDGHPAALADGADYRQRLSAPAAAGRPADFDATATRILTSSWPRAPGMNCRANSAAIAAIDPTMHFFC